MTIGRSKLAIGRHDRTIAWSASKQLMHNNSSSNDTIIKFNWPCDHHDQAALHVLEGRVGDISAGIVSFRGQVRAILNNDLRHRFDAVSI